MLNEPMAYRLNRNVDNVTLALKLAHIRFHLSAMGIQQNNRRDYRCAGSSLRGCYFLRYLHPLGS